MRIAIDYWKENQYDIMVWIVLILCALFIGSLFVTEQSKTAFEQCIEHPMDMSEADQFVYCSKLSGEVE